MFFAPTGASLPTFHNLLDELGIPDHRLARHLGVSLRTFQRYKATNNPPKVVCLALWVETATCYRTFDVTLQNEIAHHSSTVRTRDRQIAALLGHIHALEAERAVGEGYSANSPFFRLGAS
ncbi:antitoxin Xre-like helix-turn-helix domain-containing protein [Variovorax sp. UMC13]|uniref:antitoxin Xre-like helix-turn-helix domain-containing protein n=1 Tax=Variovorax sp. UMC13 TaxID=1862326 RepID=UPI001602045A|nr:antitoxin Xre-like helix-turn-helix domain-containing protein [Variovorax sp. UMC13]MBB1602551.1 hypothetical protein [Variovorax sp. UMC13]